MTLTAFSHKFNGEYDLSQYKNLYLQNVGNSLLDIQFRNFVAEDVECPHCNAKGAYIVNSGYSKLTKQAVRQEHFAFKGEDGRDAHKFFCDYYTGSDKHKVASNEGLITATKYSRNFSTKIIRSYICKGISLGLFSQLDIRNMREWFFELRSQKEYKLKDCYHALWILKFILYNHYKKTTVYEVDKSKLEYDNFDIDKETYKSLATRFQVPNLDEDGRNAILGLSLSHFFKKSLQIVQNEKDLWTFNRGFLEEKFRITTKLATTILTMSPILRESPTNKPFKVMTDNPTMAYAALLLFISNWSYELALDKHKRINNDCSEVDNDNLGNVMGLNPFVFFSSWMAIEFAQRWKSTAWDVEFEKEFQNERERLRACYEIS